MPYGIALMVATVWNSDNSGVKFIFSLNRIQLCR